MSNDLIALPEPVFPHPIRTEWKLLARLRIDHPELSLKELGKSLGFSQCTIWTWLQKPLYQSYENWLINKVYDGQVVERKVSQADMQAGIQDFAEEMFQRLRVIVETSEDERFIKDVAEDMLDRAGYAAVRKETSRPINIILTPELYERLRQRAAEAEAPPTLVIDGHTV